MTALLPSARRTSRTIVAVATVASAVLSRIAPGSAGRRAQQAMVLASLALGMPHGAADTELLRAAAAGSRPRHAALIIGYAALAAGSTRVVRGGGPWVERAVLIATAAHFGEGELACWGSPAGPARTALRAVGAATATLALPAAVGAVNRVPFGVGVNGALAEPPGRATGERPGAALLWTAEGQRSVLPLAALAGVTAAGLATRGDREAAGDVALLTALALIAPPSTAFAAYFGGWHALRHTARVVDALVADGQLPEQASLPGAVVELGRRSAWAAAVGLIAAAVLIARDPRHASDAAFAAVLGLTVPHMTTVALELSGRGRQPAKVP